MAGGSSSDQTTAPLGSSERETLTSVADPDSQRGANMLLIVMSGNDTGRIISLGRDRVLTVIGREDGSDVQLVDAEISRRHAAVRYDAGSDRYFLCDLKSRNGTAVNGQPLESETVLSVGDKVRLGLSTVLRVSLASEPEAQYAKQMFNVALRDGLTGAYNRRYLDERLVAEVAFAKRHKTPLAVLMMDLDHFKLINDEHGHQAGDGVLKRFYELLAEEVRAEDVVGRYGGEEFVVVCRETAGAGAVALAERLRARVVKTSFEHDSNKIPVTVSIGVAGVSTAVESAVDLVKAADAALYRAKNSGRNCWRLAK